MHKDIIECMTWDISVIDNIILNEQIADHTHKLLVAIQEHLTRYQDLLASDK